MNDQYPGYPMRIQARPGSVVERAYAASSLPGRAWPMPKAIASGMSPAPLDDLMYHGGKVVPEMEFQNVYLGATARWKASDVEAIDSAITRAMQHKGLNNVMSQYFPGAPLSCEGRQSIFFEDSVTTSVDEPDVRRIVTELFDQGLIAKSDLDTCIFNLLLPPSTTLRLGAAFNSLGGLGGYHGSLHLERDGRQVTLYYSANVYSQRLADGSENGIDAFDASWKNVVGTLYHELNEFRTDPDVKDAIENRDNDFLGWSSRSGAEVGDQPIFKAGAANDLGLVFKMVSDKPGARIPVQLMYSNTVHGAEGPIAKPAGG